MRPQRFRVEPSWTDHPQPRRYAKAPSFLEQLIAPAQCQLVSRSDVVTTINGANGSASVPGGHTSGRPLNRAITYVRERGEEKAFITGGVTIYRLGLAVADTMELTRVYRDFDGDAHFPEFDSSEWELIAEEPQEAEDRVSQSCVRFTYQTYRRRGASVGRLSVG